MTTSEVMLWCKPNDNLVKIIGFVKVIECEKSSFGVDQGTTYENSHKMTTSEVMLWCQPNDNLVKIIDFVKVIECEKIIWPRPGSHPRARQQKAHSAPYIIYRDQMIFSAKLGILSQQDAIGGKQGHQQ